MFEVRMQHFRWLPLKVKPSPLLLMSTIMSDALEIRLLQPDIKDLDPRITERQKIYPRGSKERINIVQLYITSSFFMLFNNLFHFI